MISQTLGHYRILEQIGAGGMGVVYRARDERLERDVALKVLPPMADSAARARLLSEARAASALNHPHICTVYEVGEADGQAYIAMEYVQGRPLSALIPTDGLPVETVIRYGVQIAGALAHAHERGVLHRDMKSSNVVVSSEGRAKVLDFGLAKRFRQEELSDETNSEVSLGEGAAIFSPGEATAIAGTLHYMAPELLRRESANVRSDIWALGVVLYETAAADLPFQGATGFELSSAILRDLPAPLPARVPAGLRAVIHRCLAKEPVQRYQRASEVGAALEALHSDVSAGSAADLGVARPRRSRRGGRSLAVLPFANATADPDTEYFSEGITESIIDSLSQLPGLRVMARSTMFRYQGRDVDPQAVGRELGVGAVLTGKVMQRGEELVITVELVDSDNGWRLWGQQYNRKLSEVVAVEEEIAEEISTKLKLKLTGEEKKRLARRHTANSEAYQLYLKGRYYWNKRTGEALKKGIEYFEQALEKDPSYALAYAGLADSYAILGFYAPVHPRHVMPKAKVAAARALEMDSQLAEAHSALAFLRFYYDWDWRAADIEFQRAFALNPNYATGHFWYSTYLSAQGRLDEAQAEMQRALELDPLSLIINTGLGWIAYFMRYHGRAIEIYRKTLELDPNFLMARYRLGQAYEQKGMLAEAIAEFQSTRAGLLLAHAYALSGRGDEARRLLKELTDLSKRRYLNSYDIAAIHVALGEPDAAFEHLEHAYEEKSGWLIYLKVDPRLDPLHADPRYTDLLKRIGLPPE